MDLNLLSKQLSSVNFASKPPKVSSHCKFKPGDILANKYVVGDILGKGRFSTVWMAINNEGVKIAVKVYRTGEQQMDYYRNETRILNKIFHYTLVSQTIPRNIVGYRGIDIHIGIGYDYEPQIYPCIIFDLAGDHIGRLLRHFKKEYKEGLPIFTVKCFMRDILCGLDYIHKCGLIHTDIKPGNILMNKTVAEADKLDEISLNIGDLGSSTSADDIFSIHVGSDCYIAPEVILEEKYTSAIDIWSAFTVCYELITGDTLFDVFDECDVDYGDSVEGEKDENEKIEGSSSREQSDDENTNNNNEAPDIELVNYADSSSDSSGSEAGDEKSTNYKHLLLIEKVLGNAPKEFSSRGREYYNARGKLKNNPDIIHIPISNLLKKNYDLEDNECKEIEEFLLCGLKYMAEDRITAEQALQHPFLQLK